MKENPLQYRVRGTPVPTTQTRGTNYPKSTRAAQRNLSQRRLADNPDKLLGLATSLKGKPLRRDKKPPRWEANELPAGAVLCVRVA